MYSSCKEGVCSLYILTMHKFLIGIDEAGRGPLAGPVSVGVLKVPTDFDWALIPGVHDSKQLSEGKREVLFKRAKALKAAGELDYAVAMVSARVIDRVGITRAIATAMARALKRLQLDPRAVTIKLDGSLKAPTEFLNQETIIKGDSKEKVIGLASIMAKVTRDRYMTRLSLCKGSPYTKYNFDIHKGYGTKAHREAILEHGLSDQHRKTYCRNLLVP